MVMYANNSPNLRFLCLFVTHQICALQGIGSRHSVPVEGLGGQVFSGVPFA